MNTPNLSYDAKSQNRLRSSVDLTTRLEKRESLTEDQKKRVSILQSRQYPNQQFGKSNINSSFELPTEEKKPQSRNYASKQRMGASSLSFAEPENPRYINEENETPVVPTSQVTPLKQRFGQCSLCISPDEVKTEKPKARVYPGNNQMLKENMGSAVMQCSMYGKGGSRLGEEHLDKQLVPPPYMQSLIDTRIGEEHLDEQLVPPEVVYTKRSSKIITESDVKDRQAKKAEPVARWFQGNGEKPLPESTPRRHYPNEDALGRDGKETTEEWTHRKIKSQYPQGHQFGSSHIKNLGESEISKPNKRGTYTNPQNFNQESQVKPIQRRTSRMGESHFRMG